MTNPLEYLFGLEFHGHKLGLENIRVITDALDRPQCAYRSVIVAGTNGKGSVCAMTAAALTAAGYRTACYTSPHLVHVRERYAIDGEPVPAADLESVVAELQVVIGRLRAGGHLREVPTFFEVATAAAFEIFRRRGADIAVLEVGMGGRLDATNVAVPHAGAITNIDLDHQQYLGPTREAIAVEKAGIIKAGMALVCGERSPALLEIIAAACRAQGARLIGAWDGADAPYAFSEGRAAVSVRTPTRSYAETTIALRGRHQVRNALVAVRLLEALDEAGVPVPGPAVEAGLAGARWRGRLELVPTEGGRSVLLDAAHNPAGAETLAAYLREVAPSGLPLVFGAVRGKDHAGMLRHLLACASRLIITTPPTPRAAGAGALRAAAQAVRPDVPVLVEPDPLRAMDTAWAFGPDIVVAGSIFLLGAVLPGLPAVPHV